jgi:hypothetical protein
MPSHVFKAATILKNTAYLCTNTEVLLCDVPGFSIRKVISLPCFNDLHHAVPSPWGSIFVAVTGLDAVAEITPEGELIRLVSVLGGSPWDRFSPDEDYRKVPTTKPHQSHPNFLFFAQSKLWVTRFHQGDAIPVDDKIRKPIIVDTVGIHDGEVLGDTIRFTTVSARLIDINMITNKRAVIDLAMLHGQNLPLGWCRGLHSEGDTAWVGFTRIRPTRLRQNINWIRHGRDNKQLPTRISFYDLTKLTLVREINLESTDMNAVFSIHRCPI